MAIKAGLVGVNPKGVDRNGMPIGSGGADVEAEIRQINLDIAQLQTSKVGVGQLEANNKSFHFAYDDTSEKYGYKLDGTGDFIPFDIAGVVGINLPDASITGLTFGSNVTYVKGGYQIGGGVLYLDITLKNTTAINSGNVIDGLSNIGTLRGIYFTATDVNVGDLDYFKATDQTAYSTASHKLSFTISPNKSMRILMFADNRTS